jgi:hypothetical protein
MGFVSERKAVHVRKRNDQAKSPRCGARLELCSKAMVVAGSAAGPLSSLRIDSQKRLVYPENPEAISFDRKAMANERQPSS